MKYRELLRELQEQLKSLQGKIQEREKVRNVILYAWRMSHLQTKFIFDFWQDLFNMFEEGAKELFKYIDSHEPFMFEHDVKDVKPIAKQETE